MSYKYVYCITIVLLVVVAASASPIREVSRIEADPSANLVSFNVAGTGVQNILNGLIPHLVSEFQNYHAPDMSGSKSIPLIGDITYSVSNIIISKLNMDHGEIMFALGSTVNGDIHNIACIVNANWSWKKNSLIHGQGTAVITLGGGLASFSVVLGEVNGKPTANMAGFNLALQQFDIDLHSDHTDWFYKVLRDLIMTKKTAIIASLGAQLQATVNTHIQQIITKIPQVIEIGKAGSKFHGVIDLSLTRPPITTSQYLSVPDLAMFLPNATKAHCPLLPAAPLNGPTFPNDSSFEFLLHQEAISCALWAFNSEGAFNVDLVDSQIPSLVAVRLRTNSTVFTQTVPQLNVKYPNQMMHLHISFSDAPKINATAANGMNLSLPSLLDFSVINSDSSLSPVFTLSGDVEIGMVVSGLQVGNNATVGVQLSSLSVVASQKSSVVGDVDTSKLNSLLKLFTSIGRGQINQMLANKRMTIPTQNGFSITNPIFTVEDGIISMAASASYTPVHLSDEQKLALRQLSEETLRAQCHIPNHVIPL